MQALFDGPTDFNRTKLGLGINVTPTNVNSAGVLADELDELRAIHPDRQIELQVTGDSHGLWDSRRLQQLPGKLVTNAIKYGAQDAPVRVTVIGDVTSVHIEVGICGPAIDGTMLVRIFGL